MKNSDLTPMSKPSDKLSQNGQTYWRSLDQLADTPEFQEWAQREFPAGASEMNDPFTRRRFVQLMSASFLLAGFGLTGCRRPESRILPFTKQPENYVHGEPDYFATSIPGKTTSTPALVKSVDGRPIKIEVNSDHPSGLSGTDAFGQASILDLYDPDRSFRFTSKGAGTDRDTVMDKLEAASKKFKSNQGAGLSILLESSAAPTRDRLLAAIKKGMPQANICIYDPVSVSAAVDGAEVAFGSRLAPRYHLANAKLIVSLDNDFLGLEEDAPRMIREYAQSRKIFSPEDSISRLYQVESTFSLTGANADHRLRASSAGVIQVAIDLAEKILAAQTGSGAAGLKSALAKVKAENSTKEGLWKSNSEWISHCAEDILSRQKGEVVILAGARQSAAVHALTHALNHLLGADQKLVTYRSVENHSAQGIDQLVSDLNQGAVDTLVILGGNPAYNAPADLKWSQAQAQAKSTFRLGYYLDETTKISTWGIPQAHYLESWGDTSTSDGVWTPVQPLIEPLLGGVTEIEVLARLAGLDESDPYSLVRDTFAAATGDIEFEEAWKQALHDGYLEGSASAVETDLQPDFQAVAKSIQSSEFPASPLSSDNLEVVFTRDYSVDDGRYNNNGWLQECPDPVSKVTWDNVISVSPKLSKKLGLKNEQVVEITVDGRTVSGPAWIQPGLADFSVVLPLGYGRELTGRVGEGTGFNAYSVRPSKSPDFVSGAKLKVTRDSYELATTQEHGSMEEGGSFMQGRAIIREANLDQYQEHPDFASKMGMEAHAKNEGSLYENPLDNPKYRGLHQWGMVIDLQSCIGCTACLVACQSENNIPIVGKAQVRRGREMHWIRNDRYYTGNLEDPQVANQPVACQHCETAPCESVCPVNATVHDADGLNVMAYNRCVGTRYCSNNCPYKVRRFNFFDYNQRPLKELYWGPLAEKGMPDLLQMVKNPDVTVRMRGVMEKCTYCVQRIQQAKIKQKTIAKDSDDVRVPDGTFTSACAQACPADAITFGDTADPESAVSKLKDHPRNYALLGYLLTKPRTTYLANVRNMNSKMDGAGLPASFKEYEEKNGDPFAHHGDDHSDHAGTSQHHSDTEKKGAH
jgi:molybdopterin-containing oxidoreductase family iron-sulfur binding subunit